MASGIKPTQEAIDAFKCLKDSKTYKYVVFNFSDNRKEVKLAFTRERAPATGGETEDNLFGQFLKDMEPYKNRACYIFYDLAYTTTGGQKRNKILMATWSDDNVCDGKEKMIVSSTKKNVAAACEGTSGNIAQINEWDDLNEDDFINIVSENRTK